MPQTSHNLEDLAPTMANHVGLSITEEGVRLTFGILAGTGSDPLFHTSVWLPGSMDSKLAQLLVDSRNQFNKKLAEAQNPAKAN